MTKTLKKLEKGAVVKMRESYKQLRENTISKELEEALKKKNQTKKDAPRKIAKPPQDVDVSSSYLGESKPFPLCLVI